MTKDLTQQELKRLLHYDPLTGVFTRIIATSNNVNVGDKVGCIETKPSGTKYYGMRLLNRLYRAHRLAFLYMNGEFPGGGVDHKDGNGLNNKWSNLRKATSQQNNKNRRLPSNNTSGFLGVCWSKQNKKWVSVVVVSGKQKYLGSFTNMRDAIAARKSANIEYGYHMLHGSNRTPQITIGKCDAGI